jgi:hypothetical protein
LIIKNRRLRNNGISAAKSKVLEAVYNYTSENFADSIAQNGKKVKELALYVDRKASFWVPYWIAGR